jgi:3-oxoacyl-[acyl-carrier protein] reductase
MKELGYGRIVNIISTSVREPIQNLGVSNTTRGAVASWAKTLSKELGPHGITVNSVLPGFTDTARLGQLIQKRAAAQGTTPEQVASDWLDTIPLGRFASADEIGTVVAFLCSPAASYISGVCLPVDGGRLSGI